MNDLVSIIATELTICESMYHTGRQAREFGPAAKAWAEALAQYLDYPGAIRILSNLFVSHRQKEPKFPTPTQFKYLLDLAKHRIIRDWWEQYLDEGFVSGKDNLCLRWLISAGAHDSRCQQIVMNIVDKFHW